MICTWEAILAYVLRKHIFRLPTSLTSICAYRVIGLVYINGGTAGFFWGYVLVATGLLLAYLSLAELASMYGPTISILRPCSC